MTLKVVPINTLTATRRKILHAAYKCVSKTGFEKLDVDNIALKAGVSRKVLYSYFNGLENLMAELGGSGIYWPSTEELLANAPPEFPDIKPEKQVGSFFIALRRTLETRPDTLRILAWEMLERSPVSEELEDIRVRTALEFFEHLNPDVPDDVDLAAAVAILGGAISYLAIRSLNTKTFGGVSLQDEIGWERMEHAMNQMLKGLLFPDK
ncbi:TetR/AcrR family transcriptional regulator [Maridesulfovibrio hydrothermalis]|uniref:Transcriptional regulator, TetR family n=1 Tax=Maridesulfovibrio hydrothermalis AM13 = DSM 14728 TaxID=1121451 RepID=L0R9I2_9BACT|nr:TetR/AcrR family transcriptional regulator [Maridesulfovibrio hydrothermalis]CCO22877.1 Transcriptional regulator, TetR family [Maridesulfovibrio hydrothermalis AM13 = DSM 14728]